MLPTKRDWWWHDVASRFRYDMRDFTLGTDIVPVDPGMGTRTPGTTATG